MRSHIALLCLGLAGCYASFPPAPEVDAGPPIDPVRAFLDARNAELCRRGIECEPEAGQGPWAQLECHPHYVADDRYVEGVQRGQLRFDAGAAAECVRLLREDAGCLREEVPAQCFDSFLANLREGDACEWSCGEGLYCDEGTCACRRSAPLHAECGDSLRCGEGLQCWRATNTCELARGLGAPCTHSSTCGDDLYCVDGLCSPASALSPGEPCVDLFECGPELTCHWTSEPGLRCDSPLAEGAACSLSECGRGLACIDRICQRLRTEGEPCMSLAECDASAAYCVEGRCTSDADGARCLRGVTPPQPRSCPAPFRCSIADSSYEGVCVHVVEPGGTCTVRAQCPLAHRCVDGACVRIVLPDEPCGPRAVCPLTHVCEGDRCAPRPVTGERCDSSRPCLQSACVAGRCGRLPAGSPCRETIECEGACVDGVCASPVGEGASCDWLLTRCAEGLFCAFGLAEPVCVRACPPM